MHVRIEKRTTMRALMLAGGLAVAPLTFTADAGIRENTACAQHGKVGTGTCCLEQSSLCNNGDATFQHYYYKSSGSCG